ncbi:KAP family NTPase [Chitinophaga horti]|uniref:KAP family NTPase n=1 Tax=Chitinophaga horti TaxID=2920382 RepID=A0ABY6IXU4_9BACT|nr:KAP family NTPase [Chitinophaga horti]UYQ92211.1 KAP family NTPase [Chitinophaga horti]
MIDDPLYFQVITEYPVPAFQKHIDDERNQHIFFSGKYGSGKSTFLEDFFRQRTDKYNVFKVSPINYSISTNEDIIRYIKYDLLLCLLEIGALDDSGRKTPTFTETSIKFAKREFKPFVKQLVKMIPEVGKSLVDAYEYIEDFDKRFYSLYDELSISKFEKLESFMGDVESAGRLYENDIITTMINSLTGKQNPDAEQRSVLIIDDLDRLDPDHTFRILNVFASQLHSKRIDRGTQLLFDKVIVVADIENIRNMYEHRYGSKTDFTGFIDKFYSSDVFHFDNGPAFKKEVLKLLDTFTVPGSDRGLNRLYLSDPLIVDIIVFLVEKRQLTLRALKNVAGKQIDYHNEDVDMGFENVVKAIHLPLVAKLKFLVTVIGGAFELERHIDKFKYNKVKFSNMLIGDLMYLLHFERKFAGQEKVTLQIGTDKYVLQSSVDGGGRDNLYSYSTVKQPTQPGEDPQNFTGSPSEYWEKFGEVFSMLRQHGYIK